MHSPGFPLLTALIVLPAIGAAVVLAIPKTRPELVKITGFAVSMGVLVLASYTLYEFATG
ncbi:MAG: NADH-quinone oxidoreductase subunit M, partial [Acidimicrobiia bacterium]|nr:NADH-quinone oxidoreductase subunit M [Acidimicrobiia bacterium]